MSHCSGCPYFRISIAWHPEECSHPQCDDALAEEPHTARPPHWCPLREGPTIVELEAEL